LALFWSFQISGSLNSCSTASSLRFLPSTSKEPPKRLDLVLQRREPVRLFLKIVNRHA
jgi:hypothetical protein